MHRLLIAMLLLPAAAVAHPGHHSDAFGDGSSFLAGLAHPLGGADHFLAMVAVGLWAGTLGGRALLTLPTAFVVLMTFGGMLGAAGAVLPNVEPMILTSVILLGAAVALMLQLPLPTATALVALFGFTHGFAHGAEAPGGSFPAYAAGFILATAALHALGLGLAVGLARAGRTPRVAGIAASFGGLLLVFA